MMASRTIAKTTDEEIRIQVFSKENSGYAIGLMNVNWNAEALTLKAVEYNAELAPENQAAPITNSGCYRISFVNYLAREDFTGTGKLFTLVFAPAENVAAATYPITFDSFDFIDHDMNDLTVSCTEGAVLLSSTGTTDFLLGDTNGDGAVSVDDAQQVLREYVRRMSGQEGNFNDMQFFAGDVNRDGQISVDDAQYILLYYVKNTLSHSPTDWYEIVK